MKRKGIEGSGLNSDIKSVLLSTIFIVILGSSFLGIIIVNLDNIKYLVTGEKKEEIGWREFKEVEKNKVGIEFSQINTDGELYDSLRRACNDYIEMVDNYADIITEVNLLEGEEIFVDGYVNTGYNKGVEMENVVETGPIYLDNKLIIRYATEDSKVKVVGAVEVGEDKEIEVYTKEEIGKEFSKYRIELGLAENEYLEDIKGILRDVLNYKKELKKISLQYFTYDGIVALISSREVLLENESKIEVVYIEMGKSGSNVKNKDRIYVEVKSGEKAYAVIMKLNEYSRIFDIDMI